MSSEDPSGDLRETVSELETRLAALESRLDLQQSREDGDGGSGPPANLKACTTCGAVYVGTRLDSEMEQCQNCSDGILRDL
ncbi:hypothetical protein ACNS7O_17270 (plasmid) [Haloferacaceae archaeon DSL9]